MEEPAKPFACTLPDCGMTFTNEDHLHVHTKKHDMVLQLGSEQKAAFVADQTPTPTRFIRNCEEVGLFQDLQNVNPFDEGFKRAMDMKHNMLTLESTNADDVLHTPQMVYPAIDNPDCTLYSNNQRNITISRSSSDETSAVKGYETTTISRLTNEVTTISRVVEKPDPLDKSIDKIKDNVANKTISYTNNVIEISNIEIRKDISDNDVNKAIEGSKEKANNNEIVNVEVPKPIMSQKSIDYVVEALTSDLIRKDNSANNVSKKKIIKSRKRSNIDYQVTLTLPNGKTVKMKAADEDEKPIQDETKEKLKTIIRNNTAKKQKPQMPVIQNVVSLQNIPTATLIPVKIVNTVGKVPILPFKIDSPEKVSKPEVITGDLPSTLDVDNEPDRSNIKRSGLPSVMECRSAASRRYRQRSKQQMLFMTEEIKRLTESNKNLTESNKKLTESNKRLTEEMSKLKMLTVEHMKKCPIADDLRNTNPEKTKPDSINIQR